MIAVDRRGARPTDPRLCAAAHRRDPRRPPDGDTISFTRLQDLTGLTPGNLITHLRKLEDADYIHSQKSGNGRASLTSVTLTRHGRAALDSYTATLRDLLGQL